MIIRMFKAVRRWELKHKIANAYSSAYIIFGIALPCAVVLAIAKIGKDYFNGLPSDALPLALFGACIVSYSIIWFNDK